MDGDDSPVRPDGDAAPPLAELTGTVMDSALLARYFDDLTRCAEVLAILPKAAAQERTGDGVAWTLPEAQTALVEGRVRGVQIRYRYDSAEWWDTLLAQGRGVRLVRIRQPS
ncbi:MAG: hypothetical protein AB7O66_18425 [Limisphaerales bacterium]